MSCSPSRSRRASEGSRLMPTLCCPSLYCPGAAALMYIYIYITKSTHGRDEIAFSQPGNPAAYQSHLIPAPRNANPEKPERLAHDNDDTLAKGRVLLASAMC